jgi:hypothetical protein
MQIDAEFDGVDIQAVYAPVVLHDIQHAVNHVIPFRTWNNFDPAHGIIAVFKCSMVFEPVIGKCFG